MQDARGIRKEEVNRDLPPIAEENGEKESAISENGASNIEDHALAQTLFDAINSQERETKK